MRTRKILVVEDSATQSQALASLLESYSFHVTIARDGEEALAIIPTGGFDLVLTDVMMPRVGGYELCRRIKQDLGMRELPVVLLTSLTDPLDIIRGLECEADNYITKPYEPQQLIARIRHVLDSRYLRKNARTNVGMEIRFLGSTFTVNSDKEQILDLFLSNVEDVIRAKHALEESQRELAAAHEQLTQYTQALQRREQISTSKYRGLMQNAKDGILVLTGNGSIDEANLRAAAMLSVDVQELSRRSFDSFLGAEQAEEFRTQLAELLAGKRHEIEMPEVVISGSSPTCCDLRGSSARVGGEDLVLVLLHDITARKRAEERLREVEKMEAVGTLAGGIAHDFNNVLTAVSGYADMLISDETLTPSALADVEEIRKAANRAANLTRQLLAFSRKQILQPRVLDVNKLLDDITPMMRPLARENVSLQVEPGANLWPIFADQSQIERVVLNLMVNARDAIADQGRITIRTRNVELTNQDVQRFDDNVQPGSYVAVSVSDTGAGMDAETRQRIFEPFFTTKGTDKGTGLGLATVYGIIKQSGGHVDVETAPGLGTTMTIFLPRATADAESVTEREKEAPHHATGAETILLVEDEDAVRQLARRVLVRAGYHVLEAGNGVEGERTANEYEGEIALLLTDVVMPQMSGPQLARHLQSTRPQLRVLFMSGYLDPQTGGQPLDRGAALVEKPFAPATLLKTVRQMLSAPGLDATVS